MQCLTKDQIEDLLVNVLQTDITYWKGDKMQVCCPVHGESNPSCGIVLDINDTDMYHCFSCGSKGTIDWLLYQSDCGFSSMKEAEKFICDRFNLEAPNPIQRLLSDNVQDYDKMHQVSKKAPKEELSILLLAPYQSGKVTYKYFFNRGFSKEDMKYFKIGLDKVNKTVTIPVFWGNGKLGGVVGRYIDPLRPKNMRYKLYEFKKSQLVYPLDKLKVKDDTIIIVEGIFDAMMLHKWGITNAVSILGNELSDAQAKIIKNKCSKVILLYDNDLGGLQGKTIAKKKLKGLTILEPNYLPKTGKDICEWGYDKTIEVLKSCSLLPNISMIK